MKFLEFLMGVNIGLIIINASIFAMNVRMMKRLKRAIGSGRWEQF